MPEPPGYCRPKYSPRSLFNILHNKMHLHYTLYNTSKHQWRITSKTCKNNNLVYFNHRVRVFINLFAQWQVIKTFTVLVSMKTSRTTRLKRALTGALVYGSRSRNSVGKYHKQKWFQIKIKITEPKSFFWIKIKNRQSQNDHNHKITISPSMNAQAWAAPGGGQGGQLPPCPRPAPQLPPPSLAERVCGAPWWNELHPMHLAL